MAEHLPADVAPATLSEYRLSIARQARRYKYYPALARQRGSAGEVGLVVMAGAGAVPAQVRLERSSGDPLLDDAALTIIRQALQQVPPPAEWHGRRWQIQLPLAFTPEG